MNITYVDRVNLIRNIQAYNRANIKDLASLQKLIDDHVVTIKPDYYKFSHRNYQNRKEHQIIRVEKDPVILNTTAYNTYEEAEQVLTVLKQPLSKSYRNILREVPVEVLPELYNFLYKLPPDLRLHWRGHELRYTQPRYKMDEVIWEIPIEWVPDTNRFPSIIDAINYYLDINRYRSIDLKCFAKITDEVGYHQFKQEWFQRVTGYMIRDYILKRKMEKVKDLMINTDLGNVEINQITGLAKHQCNFCNAVRDQTGYTPTQWRKVLREEIEQGRTNESEFNKVQAEKKNVISQSETSEQSEQVERSVAK